ncbi:HepT-like ribonuclease domain-containing protein [Microseira wollei]|uniref:DUF86 domain-containing protein n=1 Tax=Microseira wollei NIES-4236 TaxID=2530354 RepID=A0AAV3XB29_9CYAN|nr:DUF86 domain-containing protein [Microseira wollei]GET37826.1 protein of unknown function DUF86 [Microseira wollei NIES-4236]
MPANRDMASLLDIVQACQMIQRYIAGIDRDGLAASDEKQAAILYRIMVIGETTKRISNEFRAQHPEIPWKDMAGMRDWVSHAYDRVDLDIVWDVAQNKIPQLLVQLEPLISTN